VNSPRRFRHDPSTLFGRLRAACSEEWRAYCEHEFVQQIAGGTLPEACFRHYLEQDYLFLIHFARAWALAVYKADSVADMAAYAESLRNILHREMALHVKYCEGWGLSAAGLERVAEARPNLAYTRYVLERGLAGDILDLHVALAPCVLGYAEIGARLLSDPSTVLQGNPYRDWIEAYGGEDYQTVADQEVLHLERLAETRLGPGRLDGLTRTFRQATLLEVGFWDMGLRLER